MSTRQRFAFDFLLAASGLALGGGAGYFGCRGYYGGQVNDPVVDTLAPLSAAICAGIGGILGANIRNWLAVLWPKPPNQK